MTASVENAKTVVFLPAWLSGGVRQVDRSRWLAHWKSVGKAHPATMRVAEAFTAKGFRHATGQQVHPKAASVIALDAGTSPRSVERFLEKGRKSGYLTPTGETRLLREGAQATPMYALTTPLESFGKPASHGVPASVRAEFQGLAEVSREMQRIADLPAPWASRPDEPPSF